MNLRFLDRRVWYHHHRARPVSGCTLYGACCRTALSIASPLRCKSVKGITKSTFLCLERSLDVPGSLSLPDRAGHAECSIALLLTRASFAPIWRLWPLVSVLCRALMISRGLAVFAKLSQCRSRAYRLELAAR